MLRKLISTALRRELPGDDLRVSPPVSQEDRPAPDFSFPPMEPLHPPDARNDNPLTDLCVAVETELRAAGYLR